MKPLVQGSVVIYGGIAPDGDGHKRCRVTMNGEPTTAVLYIPVEEEQRWVPIDRLTDAKITDGNGMFTIEGISDEMVEMVDLKPENARVRWEVTPKGCRDCG